MKRTLTFLLIFLTLLSLTACKSSAVPVIDTTVDSPFVQIEDTPYLSYDKYTRIIYYFFRDKSENESSSVTGYLSEYYNRNGKLCQYINESIVEIND